MHDKVIIFDFGSQYTQLIARRIRESNTYCEIIPYNKEIEDFTGVKGIILSGSPFSVKEESALQFPIKEHIGKYPILGVCYGAQYMVQHLGGNVERSNKREYGRAHLVEFNKEDALFHHITHNSQVWMSHGDSIIHMPDDSTILAKTETIPVAAFKLNGDHPPVYGIQFHPEVYHSVEGKQLIGNFVHEICGCKGDWTPQSFVEETVEGLKKQLGDDKVVLGLSGGVDSSVAALLLHQAIGKNLYCIFINNGVLRYKEFDEVLESYQGLGLNVKGVDATDEFMDALEGIEEPEAKRKAIGKVFIDVFQAEASHIRDVKWLAQGTIYPDIIESVSVYGPSAKIKSHHNVGGLPEKMHLKIVEPLKRLFKDEVRKVGAAVNLPEHILERHPFPGPGLAIRILGDITREKVRILQLADEIYIRNLKDAGWYNKIWQAGVMLLNVRSVGVMGDERTYENAVALRAVMSVDGMTADWSRIPYDLLAKISNDIINNVKGINRVVYDISSKPPATIEWE